MKMSLINSPRVYKFLYGAVEWTQYMSIELEFSVEYFSHPIFPYKKSTSLEQSMILQFYTYE